MALKVAIAGYGAEGESSARYWLDQGANVTIFDATQPSRSIPETCEVVTGEKVFENLDGYDLVVRTPSLRPDTIKTDGKIWSSTNEFFATCPAPIIGVTGTKGKGTTSTLIAEILKAAGKTVHLVGNIGVPSLDVLPRITKDDIVVFELSSFQLWDLEKSPHTAVVLMMEPDHLDVHKDMDEYIAAKAGITRSQTEQDVVIFHPTNSLSAQIAGKSHGKKRRYMTTEAAHIENDQYVIDKKVVCKTSDAGLIGGHNQENICAAVSAAWRYTQDTTAVAHAIRSFTGLPHRLEYVAEKNGVKYYDDSFSTGPGATQAALRAFDTPVLLIIGGWDKGVDMSDFLAHSIQPEKHVLILIGNTAEALAVQCQKLGYKNYITLGTQTTMTEIVNTAARRAHSGDVVLLSPAHASFGLFESYYQRGELFQAAVRAL